MKGIIIKDFINLKKNAKIFGALTLLYGVMAIAAEDTSFFTTVLIVLVSILTLSLYSYDEMAKWDSYALTMPLSKDNIVQGKYMMMLLLTLIGVVYSSTFTLIINIYKKTDSLLNGFSNIGAGAAVVIIFYCITLPFITKLGVEKARLIFFAVYIIPFVVIVALNKLRSQGSLVIPEKLISAARAFMDYVYIIVPLILLIALGTSYIIARNIYRKKEF